MGVRDIGAFVPPEFPGCIFFGVNLKKRPNRFAALFSPGIIR